MAIAPLRVLVVEHAADTMQLVREALAPDENLSCDVTPCVTLTAALVCIGAGAQFDVALLDLRLPDADRLDALVHLRAHAPSLPIVVLTGMDSVDGIDGVDDAELEVEALAAGAQQCVRIAELTTAVLRNAIRQARVRQRFDAARAAEREQFRLVVDTTPDLIAVLDRLGRYRFVNATFKALLGYDSEQLIGQPITQIHPEDLPPLLPVFSDVAEESFAALAALEQGVVIRLLSKSGDQFFVEARGRRFRYEDDPSALLLVARDVSGWIRAEERLRTREASFRQLFADNPHPMAVFDEASLYFIEVNSAALAEYGYSREEFLAMRISDERLVVDVPRLATALAGELPSLYRGEWQHRTKSGELLDVEVATRRLLFAGRPAMLVSAADITQRKQREDELRRQALHDGLTGLPNRSLLQDRLRQTLEAARRRNTTFGLLVLDINEFKWVNDTFGHAAGDLVLKEIGQRLLAVLRRADTVARIGGDEFAILLPATPAPGATAVAWKVREAIAEPLHLQQRAVSLSASVGIAVFPTDGDNADSLLQRADSAMYLAKGTDAGVASRFAAQP